MNFKELQKQASDMTEVKDSFSQVKDALVESKNALEKLIGAVDDLTGTAKGGEVEPDAPVHEPFPWMNEAKRWEGLNEEDDKDKLNELLGDGYDWEVVSWCAQFVNKVFERVGIEGTGSMRARDFADWGEESTGAFGDVAVFSKHVGFLADNDKKRLLGGNQGNSVKESNLAWFHSNMEFLGYRKPPSSVV